jgi:multidrug efflux pump subunit AcrA (membrane-fusion protein)
VAQARAAEVQAIASSQQVVEKLGAQVGGQFAQVAQINAQLESAQWNLDQTTTRSPCDCYVINLQLRPGGFVAGLPLNPVMSLVEVDGQVVAFYAQNELTRVEPGDEAEFALDTYPGRIIKGKVDSIIWAMGQGQLPPSGIIPMSTLANQPPGQFAVKFDLTERDRALFLAAGAVGDAAIYTQHLEFLHLIRKVLLRVGSYTNYLILKLH